MSDLNQYASTIRAVMEQLACLYADESSTGEWDEAGMAILGMMDADTLGEIISTARQIEKEE
jgi:hypothetical protein